MKTWRSDVTHNPAVQLRPFETSDISTIVALWYRTWHHTFPDLHHPDPLATWERRFRDDFVSRSVGWLRWKGRLLDLSS